MKNSVYLLWKMEEGNGQDQLALGCAHDPALAEGASHGVADGTLGVFPEGTRREPLKRGAHECVDDV